MDEEIDEVNLNYDDILNDNGLHKELLELGWEDDDESFVVTSRNDNASLASPDIGSVGLVNEDDLQLTAEDMEDPDLLQELVGLEDVHSVQATELGATTSFVPLTVPKLVSDSNANTAKLIEKVQTPDEAKRMAIKYKREGNDDEALRWFRTAKQLESQIARGSAAKIERTNKMATQSLSNLSGKREMAKETVPVSVLPVDSFAPLEDALNEASAICLREAKRLEHVQPKLAVEKLREYKTYQQELTVLQSRRLAGGSPTLFRWHTTQKRTVLENLDIGEDQVKVVVEAACDLESVLEGHTSRSVSISYSLGLGPKDDEVAPLTSAQAKYENGRVQFNYTATLSCLKRGRHVQQLYARKKATFDLVLHRGFFKSNLLMCQAVLPLADLLTKSEIGGVLPLTSSGQKEGVTHAASSVKKGKAVGGTLNVVLRIRTPLMGPDVRVVEERTLVLDPWPTVSSAAPMVTSPDSVGRPREDLTSVAQTRNVANRFASICQKEKDDPHSPDWLESNDVLEMEIQLLEAQLRERTAAMDEDELFGHQLRLQLLQAKLQILVCNVQNESLSIESYLEAVRSRLVKDQLLAVYFKTLGDESSTAHAIRIMRRIRVMQEEIRSAESAQADDSAAR